MFAELISISEVKAWFYSICIGLIVLYIFNYVKQIRSYPPGPFPLPFFGNLLSEYYTVYSLHCNAFCDAVIA